MKATKTRYLMLLLSFIGVIICYMDRSAISYAITPIKQAFHLNNQDFGIISSAFGIGYLLMMPLGGVLTDRHGARLIWTIAALLWSIVTVLIGFSTGIIMLIILRVLLGVAEAPSFPSLTKAIANWLPINERNRALALALAAVPFASVIGAPLSTWLIATFNWKFMFIFLGIAGIIWTLAWYLLFRNTPKESSLANKQEIEYINANLNIPHLNPKTHWKSILFNKTFALNNYAFFAFGYLLFFGVTWLPGYLEQSFNLKLKAVGLFLIMPWLLASIFMLLTGIISDHIWAKTKSLHLSRSLIIAITLIISAILFIPVVTIHNLTIDIIFISLAIAFGLASNGCFYSLNADLAPKYVATSLAIMDTCFALSGILAPIITGYLTGISGNFELAIYIMVGLNISAGLLILLFQNPDKAVTKM